ncbi:LysR family substrate-binding domain-containing protein [Pseudomonas sp. A34-9]|uniref:LysR family substrate-binding domain-containing protein n=1 Tax=Pseudomonas sp. A34-9 TaxID=3034675 RepID=UPI00240E5861|nr:LysR family substrate-binding domain-containing protein [Pseudomonas sp. A34-9]
MRQTGHVFLDEARLTLAQAGRSVERARQAALDHSGRLTLGFVFGVEAEQLMRVMSTLHGELRHMQLILHTQSSPMLITELLERQIDVAFIRPSSHTQGLNVRTLRSEKLIAAVPADHALAKQTTIRLTQLAAEPMIGVPREQAPVLYDAIQEYADRYGVALQPVYHSETLMMALSLITSVGGVCLLPEHSALIFPKGVVAVPLGEESPLLELALAWHPENRSSALTAFIDAFLDQEPQS